MKYTRYPPNTDIDILRQFRYNKSVLCRRSPLQFRTAKENNMDSFEPKKLALIRILQILKDYTDCDHPLTHEEIVSKLYSLYNITVERKAIGRNIVLLQEAGYDIETTKKGSFLSSRLFEDSELRLLTDSVLASQHITAKHS